MSVLHQKLIGNGYTNGVPVAAGTAYALTGDFAGGTAYLAHSTDNGANFIALQDTRSTGETIGTVVEAGVVRLHLDNATGEANIVLTLGDIQGLVGSIAPAIETPQEEPAAAEPQADNQEPAQEAATDTAAP